MERDYWKAGNMIYPLPAVMVTTKGLDGKDNILTVAWCGTICTNPAMAYISVRPERYSYKALVETKEFVINLVTEDLVKSCDYCGVRSGRDIDKFKECNLTRLKLEGTDVFGIKESHVNIICKVKEVKELGSHHMFISDVIKVCVDNKYMDDTNRFNLDEARLITYSHGQYYKMGERLGKFGYSVKKNK